MSYNVIPTPDFKKSFKKLLKKYPSIKSDLSKLIDTLTDNPETGSSLGGGLYKIRMAISTKGKGKSAGARVITFLITEEQEIYLIHIYDKSELEDVPKSNLLTILKRLDLI